MYCVNCTYTHEVEHLPEGELKVHLAEVHQAAQVLPPLRRRRHAGLGVGRRGQPESSGRAARRSAVVVTLSVMLLNSAILAVTSSFAILGLLWKP